MLQCYLGNLLLVLMYENSLSLQFIHLLSPILHVLRMHLRHSEVEDVSLTLRLLHINLQNVVLSVEKKLKCIPFALKTEIIALQEKML